MNVSDSFVPFKLLLDRVKGLEVMHSPDGTLALFLICFALCSLLPSLSFFPYFIQLYTFFFFLITQISLDKVVGFFLRITDNEEILRKITVHSTLQGGSILHSRNT